MQDVFEEGPEANQPGEANPGEQQPQGAEQGQQQPAQSAEQQQPSGEAAASPAASEQGKHVPLEALEAERKGRQDWKEKATRAEERLRVYEEREQRAQQSQQQFQMPQLPADDPLAAVQQRDPQLAATLYMERVQRHNERFNISEMLVRDKYADVDEMVNTFKAAAEKNPGLSAAMHAHPQPWKFAYEEGKRLRFATEIGNDPEAYRKKVRAEIEAELKAAPPPNQPATPAPPVIPQSLADARSAGARGNTFTGPPPFEELFPN